MFNRQPRDTPAAEKASPIVLGEGRPAPVPTRAATGPFATGMPLLARRLPALGGAMQPSLPPRDVAAAYDHQLEALMGEAARVYTAASTAARAWLSGHQGGGDDRGDRG